MITTRRFVAMCAVGFLASNVLAVIFLGFVLNADFEPFRGTLLRSGEALSWQIALSYPIKHLAFVSAFVWMYSRMATPGGGIRQGLKFGVMAWLMTQVPQWLTWYAEQPWPGELITKALALELASVLTLSVVVTVMSRSAIETSRRGS
jgi:hypothetical protein